MIHHKQGNIKKIYYIFYGKRLKLFYYYNFRWKKSKFSLKITTSSHNKNDEELLNTLNNVMEIAMNRFMTDNTRKIKKYEK